MSCSKLKDKGLISPAEFVYIVIVLWPCRFTKYISTSQSICPSVQLDFPGVVSENLTVPILQGLCFCCFEAPLFASLSATSFPAISLCPGIHCMITLIGYAEIRLCAALAM